MGSPFPTSISKPGEGRIVVSPLPSGGNGLQTITYQYPLKLISPTPSAQQKSVLVFLLSYGGGLVGGDCINLHIDVQSRAALSLVTQGHTKVFKSASPDIVTRQNLQIRVRKDASLCLLPDPVQPFADSVYAQKQTFTLEPTSTLCFLDWVTQGRTARGENWSFVSWKGCNEVWLAGDGQDAKPRLLVRDAVILSSPDSVMLGRTSLRDAMHQMAVFGTLILRGPKVQRLADLFMAEFAALPRLGARDFRTIEDQAKADSQLSELDRWRAQRIRMEREQGILWSAAHVRSCVIVKLGAKTVEGGREWVGAMLSRDGSVEEHFGEQALMCVK
jgi:urease accessory protein